MTVESAPPVRNDSTEVQHDAPAFIALRVAAIDHDTADSVVVTFDTTGHERYGRNLFSFQHGQHLTLRREFDGVEVRRSYSICSTAPDGRLRIAIKHVAGGVFSTWAMNELSVGDPVDVMTPAGHFTCDLDPSATRRYAMLAAGSGITPVYSLVATILDVEPAAQVSLVYVNRSSLSTMLLDDLHDLRDRHLGRLRLAFVFTREESGGELLSGRPDRGRLDALVDAGFLPADADHAFLCGPIDLITDAEHALVAAGIDPAKVHREIFTTNQPGQVTLAPQEITETSVTVATGRANLHGRASQFDIYEGDSVLDAVQRVRPDAPFSCRSGVCSTCQAVIRDGDVEMEVNYGLTPDETARGYILTCQSHPTTPHIDIDYDA